MIPIQEEDERSTPPPARTTFDWSGSLDTRSTDSDAFEPVPLDETACTSSIDDDSTSRKESAVGGDRKRSSTSNNNNSPTSEIRLRRRKKPRGMPKRPLSAYNIFFQRQSAKLMSEKSNGASNVSFEDMGKILGKQWRNLTKAELSDYKALAAEDSVRYRREMQQYNEAPKQQEQQQIKIEETKEQQQEGGEFQEESNAEEAKVGDVSSRAYGPSYGPQHHEYHAAAASQDASVAATHPMYGTPSQAPPQQHAQYPSGSGGYYYGSPYEAAQQQQHHHRPNVPPYYSPTSSSGAQQYPPHLSSPTTNAAVVQPRFSASLPYSPQQQQQQAPSSPVPLRHGQQLTVEDQDGMLRRYQVQYAVMCMNRDEALSYVQGTTGGESSSNHASSSRRSQQQGSSWPRGDGSSR